MNTPTTLEHEEPVFPEEEGGPPRPLDFYGLSIPPLGRELRRQLAAHFHHQGLAPAWYLPRPLNDLPYRHFQHTTQAGEMPCLLMDAGPRHFCNPGFEARWRGLYTGLPQIPLSATFSAAGLDDPAGRLRPYGTACWVILADLEMLGDRPLPKGWSDLFNPCYAGDIIANGEKDCLAPLLLANLARDYGADALTRLARQIRAVQGGGEMARAAGGRSPHRAALYVLPRFWAENNIHKDNTRIIWPEEGAYCTPLILLGQQTLTPGAAAAFDFLTGPAWAAQLEGIYCIPADPALVTRPLPGPLRWIGWDLARSPDLEALVAQAGTCFRQGYRP